jgi:hypothetical protein
MSTSQPPRAATWLLQHLVPGSMNEALAGDLMEAFERRGAAWYWRQVLLSIGAAWGERLRDEWGSIAFSFAYVFIGGERLARLNMRLFAWMPQRPWGIGLPWPWSLVVEIATYALQGLPGLWAGLVLYLVIARRCTCRGLIAGIATVVVAYTAWITSLEFLMAYHYHQWLLFPLGDTLVLLLAIWVGQRPPRRSITTSLS